MGIDITFPVLRFVTYHLSDQTKNDFNVVSALRSCSSVAYIAHYVLQRQAEWQRKGR